MRILALFTLCLTLVRPALASDALEHGRYLVESIVGCGNCHTPLGPNGPVAGQNLAGRFVIEEEAFTAYAPNITPDKETGIGAWSKTDLIKAIRNGIRPDGSLIGPPIPIGLYRGISDKDVDAIATYVMSLPAVRNVVSKSIYRIPLPPNYGPPVTTVPEPTFTNAAERGAYLAGPIGHCVECHTPMVNGRPDFENRLAAGGFPFHGPWGISVSANITPDKATGIGEWTDAEIKRAITTGVSRDGRKLFPPMGFAYYAKMKPADLDAIVAYLHSLKPIPSQ